jgi:hypothetical protein
MPPGKRARLSFAVDLSTSEGGPVFGQYDSYLASKEALGEGGDEGNFYEESDDWFQRGQHRNQVVKGKPSRRGGSRARRTRSH